MPKESFERVRQALMILLVLAASLAPGQSTATGSHKSKLFQYVTIIHLRDRVNVAIRAEVSIDFS